MHSTRYARPGLVVWQLVLILLALGIGFFVVYRQIAQRQRQPEEVAAEVLRADPDSGDGRRVMYRYVVGGRSFDGEDRRNTWYEPDSTPAKVCYDPGNPANGRLRRQGDAC